MEKIIKKLTITKEGSLETHCFIKRGKVYQEIFSLFSGDDSPYCAEKAGGKIIIYSSNEDGSTNKISLEKQEL